LPAVLGVTLGKLPLLRPTREGIMTIERPPKEREAGWRRVCLAYPRVPRQAGASEQEAHEAAVAAVQTVLPLPLEARAGAVNAVAYATRYHFEWFCRGAKRSGAQS
jgi:hypothetical protein